MGPRRSVPVKGSGWLRGLPEPARSDSGAVARPMSVRCGHFTRAHARLSAESLAVAKRGRPPQYAAHKLKERKNGIPDTSWAEEVLPPETMDELNELVSGERTEKVTIDPRHALTPGTIETWKKSQLPHCCSGADGLPVRKPRKRRYWPFGRGNYTTFALYKENADTMEAVNMIASVLRQAPSCFAYAGTKDKRGKTCQLVSVYRVPARNLLGLNKRKWALVIGNVSYEEKGIKLGDLLGNRFAIILRDVVGSRSDIEEAVQSLSEKGFINYYGTQRFGTTSVSTQEIGRELLKGNYEAAVHLVLKPREGGNAQLSACREEWARSGDALKALSLLQHKGSIEGLLLQGLLKNGPKAFVCALLSIPRNVRLMYIHGYQSYIWNKVVSRRLRKFGLAVLEGDLVVPADVPGAVLESEEGKFSKQAEPTVVKDIAAATLGDVVLPLPGYSVKYPKNEIAEWYKEMLAEDGLTLDSFNNKNRAFAMSGCYRHIVTIPRDVTWEEVTYEDPSKPLLLSDLDALRGNTLPEQSGSHRGLRMEFSLPSSCYATMAIRELTRSDTTAWAAKTP
ncbi:hypothetical protein HPB47_022399 [Ixodes persulcatus]|uniref:Uncharacterized protein n=1 Tax=Ixodes persulcatus TaxID=34615 RepID=A0AC60QD61_IXOPE|nr:hypothetical protein HPB47_022399 [Ixodes persulcatus]